MYQAVGANLDLDRITLHCDIPLNGKLRTVVGPTVFLILALVFVWKAIVLFFYDFYDYELPLQISLSQLNN